MRKTSLIRVFVSAALLFTTGWAQSAEVVLPANTKLAIVFDQSNKATVLGTDGTPAVACQLCTEDMEAQFGAHCANAPATVHVCGSVTTATLQNIETIQIIKSHRNPHCYTYLVNGVWYTFPDPCIH